MSLIDPGADWAGAYEQEKRWREVEQEEKRELELEIKRHHQDFQQIRDLLDYFSPTFRHDETNMKVLIRKIRNIVG